MRRVLIALLVLVFSLSILGCSSKSDQGAASGDVIKIGVSGPLTGPSAESGIGARIGIELATKEINDAGGIEVDGKKKKIQLFFEDAQSKPEVGLSVCEKLLSVNKVDFLFVETINSSVAMATMELAKKYPAVMASLECVGSGIAKKVKNDPSSYKNFYKMAFNSEAYGLTVANTVKTFVDENKIPVKSKTIAYIAEDTDYGRSNVEAAENEFKKMGFSTASKEFLPTGTTDFYPQLNKVNQSAPDVVVSCFTSAASGAALIRQYKENSVQSTHIAIFYPSIKEFKEQIGTAADGLIWTPLFNDFVNNPKHVEFKKKVKDGINKEATHDIMQAYDAAMNVYDAIRRAGSTNPEKLSKAMLEMNTTGYIGHYVFDKETHTVLPGPEFMPVFTSQIKDGKDGIVWPLNVAVRPYEPQNAR